MSGRRNGLLGTDGRPPIANGMLVALTLMVAESRPDEKDSKHQLVGYLRMRLEQGSHSRW